MAALHSIDPLRKDLRSLGVASGAVMMVHASLRAFGPTEHGAAGVIAALDDAVEPGGTLLMVLGAANEWAWVNDLREPERPAALADAEPLDAATTPADPGVGTLAAVVRSHPRTSSQIACGVTWMEEHFR